jgi:transcriptional regulator with XRE-family HTH domain
MQGRSIADALDAELRRRGWNQTEAALELGVKPSTVNRWLLGVVPRPDAYEALRGFLRADADNFAKLLLTSLEQAHKRRGR